MKIATTRIFYSCEKRHACIEYWEIYRGESLSPKVPTHAMHAVVFALLRTLLGRNLRHVDLAVAPRAIRAGTNAPLFYNLAFGQLTWLVPGDSLTLRASQTMIVFLAVRSFRHKVAELVRCKASSSYKIVKDNTTYVTNIWATRYIQPCNLLFVEYERE